MLAVNGIFKTGFIITAHLNMLGNLAANYALKYPPYEPPIQTIFLGSHYLFSIT